MLRFIALLAAVVFCIFSVAATSFSLAAKIDHFIVLMLENRAFDEMLGYMNRENPEIDGINPNFFNEWDGIKYYAGTNASYVCPFDPDHSFTRTTFEVMGAEYPARKNPAPMSGFVGQAYKSGHPYPEAVMQAFTPDRVPAISTLAREFALFDKYFCSIPGPTVVNRIMFNSGSSFGHVEGGTKKIIEGFPGRTNYDFFNENNVSWKAYFEDISDLWYMTSLRNLTGLTKHFRFYPEFAKDAAAGTLPQFTWISPRFYADFGKPARDQHPAHDVRYGEQILSEVYHAVRNSPKWNNTALLITYDEHGGFADHVSPPDPVPNPLPTGAVDIEPPFNFTRGGVRIPTILVSPWVKKGHVEHRPVNGTEYEACSIFNTLQELFNFPNTPLSARQAWASSYAHLLDAEPTPRTDCPTSIPTPPMPSAAEEAHRQMKNPPSGLQKEFYDLVEGLHGRSGLGVERFATVGELGKYIRAEVKAFLDKHQEKEAELLRELKH